MNRRPATPEIHLGVSSCLLGEEVRYDGTHARDTQVIASLAGLFTLIAVCPETELGMGVPRETVRLVGTAEAPHMLGSTSQTDWTARMNRWSARRARELLAGGLCGYVFKSKSPSCGVWRVKLYREKGRPVRQTRGLFAAEILQRAPWLPVTEESRLADAAVRDDFIARVRFYHRLGAVFAGRWRRRDLLAFHERECALLLACSPGHARRLTKLVAGIADYTPAAFRNLYIAGFMTALAGGASGTRA